MKNTAIYALTPQGAHLGHQLTQQLEGHLFLPVRLSGYYESTPFERLFEIVADNFNLYPRQIFITALGIVVRAIAPHIKCKDQDPAIIVMDQNGKYVISLLSGHLGGANKLAQDVSLLTGGQPVITTATDTAGVPAIDVLAQEKDLAILNLGGVKYINMAILTGDPIQIFDPERRLGTLDSLNSEFAMERVTDEDWIEERPGVWVTWKYKFPHRPNKQLVLHPKCLVAGIGCNSGTDKNEIIDFIQSTFREHDLALKSLKCLTSIDAKNDEKGLLAAARSLEVPISFFSRSEIEHIDVPNPSALVKKHMGVMSVCEATAILKSKGGKLLVPKAKSRNVTLAVALVD